MVYIANDQDFGHCPKWKPGQMYSVVLHLQSHLFASLLILWPRENEEHQMAWKMYSAYSVFSLSRLPNWRRGLIPWVPPGGSVDGSNTGLCNGFNKLVEKCKINLNLALLEKISQEVVNQTCLHASIFCWLLSFAFTFHWLPESPPIAS